MPLDDTDRALLALLRDNARASTAELARKLDLARTTVQSRLARLEQSRTRSSAIRSWCPTKPRRLWCAPMC
jgi:DNA-binding Lrp family transcriptional regulator